MAPPVSLDEEVRLYTTNAEREKYESQATLFGVIVALDYLERAYVRDSIPASECVHPGRGLSMYDTNSMASFTSKRYSPACTRLLSQYKTMLKLVSDAVPSVEDFMARYRVRILSERRLLSVAHLKLLTVRQMDHPAALHRLKVGVPATVEHSSEAGVETGKWVAETTQVRSYSFSFDGLSF